MSADDAGLGRWLGAPANQRLADWSRQRSIRHRLVRAFDNGGTAAKIALVNRHHLAEKRTEKLVLKHDRYDGADLSQSEYARHSAALFNDDWARKHLAALAEPLLPVDDGTWIVFQSVAGPLDQYDVLSALHWGLVGQAELRCDAREFAEVVGAIVKGILGDWNGDPDISYLPVPDYLRRHLVYRLKPGKPLHALTSVRGDAAFALLADPSVSEGIEVAAPFGKSHGDVHLENVLVRTRPRPVNDAYKLIDLANGEVEAPLARDPAHLLMHMVNRSLEHLGPPALDALPEVLLDPESRQASRLPVWLRETIPAIYEAGDAWTDPPGFGSEWRCDRPLSLYAATLMVYARKTVREADKAWLLSFARTATERFLDSYGKPAPKSTPSDTAVPVLAPSASGRPRGDETLARRPRTDGFVVGRSDEPRIFDGLVAGTSGNRLLNIYGPGGIGKSVVCGKLADHAVAEGLVIGSVDISEHPDDPAAILRELAGSLAGGETADGVSRFIARIDAYDALRDLVRASGGIEQMYETTGKPIDPAAFAAFVDSSEVPLTPEATDGLGSRFRLNRYLGGAVRNLTSDFCDLIGGAVGHGNGALFLDTYEEVRSLDRWVRLDLVPRLPESVKMVLLGRNMLTRQNFDWSEHSDTILMRPLPELTEDEAKAYLRHFGLSDPVALDRIHRVTGGYPLILVLVRQLAREAGGWEAVGQLEYDSDRDRIAGLLLERILREERVIAVREVLEKCAVAAWINPEIIQALLGVGRDESRELFTKVSEHSFMDRHRYGVRLHETIRQLLRDRLRYTSQSEFDELEAKLLAYHSAKTRGLAPEDPA